MERAYVTPHDTAEKCYGGSCTQARFNNICGAQQQAGSCRAAPPAARFHVKTVHLLQGTVPLAGQCKALLNSQRSCQCWSSRAGSRADTAPAASNSNSASTAAASTGSGSSSSQPGSGEAIYSRPQLYEAAFSYRDLKQEVRFLRDVYKAHCPNQGLSAILDLGCGPGPHAIGLAQAGISVVGLDLNPAMLEYARGKAAASSKPLKGKVSFVQGDLRSVPDALAVAQGQPEQQQDSNASSEGAANGTMPSQFDMVTCLLGTLTHCLTNSDAAAAFRGAAQVLRPGGILVLELAHPGDLFDGTLIIGDGGKEMWEVPQGKDGKLLVEWGADFDEFNVTTQVIDRTVTINVFKGEDVVQTVEEVVPARQFTVQELQLLGEAAGLSLVQLYGDMSMSVDLQHEEAYRMVAVLRKP